MSHWEYGEGGGGGGGGGDGRKEKRERGGRWMKGKGRRGRVEREGEEGEEEGLSGGRENTSGIYPNTLMDDVFAHLNLPPSLHSTTICSFEPYVSTASMRPTGTCHMYTHCSHIRSLLTQRVYNAVE